jgi:peptidoglycan/LPS O-acetylase OafA/YrhL
MNARHAYLDWLRIFAIIGVLFFHSAMPFVAEEGWHIKNNETSNLLMEMNFFMSRFRMPLLFFISGAVACFMLKRRSAGGFIRLRFQRLLIPLVFGMLLIVPVQVYMERLNQGFTGSFREFYSSVFTTGPYPAGNLSWHHLWFIAYLFLYDVLLAPFFKWCLNRPERLTFFVWLSKGRRLYLAVLPSVVCFSALVLRYPQTNDLLHDWCYLVYWLFFLLAGFFFGLFPGLMDSLTRNRRFSLQLAVVAILLLNYLRWNKQQPWHLEADWQNLPTTYLYFGLLALTAWLWVFALLGYGKRYLNKTAAVQSYINSAVYPFYILHQTVIVVIAWYVVKTNDTILLKYAFVVVTTFLITVAVYHLFIRPFTLMRFLFGVKLPAKTPKLNSPLPETSSLPVPA